MTEKFAVGDKVYLIHLDEEGVVTRLEGAEMLMVQLATMEIPVYCSDVTKTIPDRKFPDKKASESTVAATVKPEPNIQRQQQDSTGEIFLGFEPQKDSSGDILKFKIGLANDTPRRLKLRYRFFLSGNIHFQLDAEVAAFDVFPLHEINFDLLNELPEVDVLLRDPNDEIFKGDFVQKIKPKNFFNKLGSMALTGNEAYCYRIETVLLKKPAKKELQKAVVKNDSYFDPETLKMMMLDSPGNKDMTAIEAKEEVDLHIEKLVSDPSKMDNAEMLHVQLARFQKTLDRAIAGGLHRIYMIHGNGKGKLKNEIHKMLEGYKEVKSYNNHWHPKYGFGATEIILH